MKKPTQSDLARRAMVDAERRRFLQAACGTGLAAYGLTFAHPVLAARSVAVSSVNAARHEGFTRYVFRISAPVDFETLLLDDPLRAVVDVRGTQLGGVSLPAVSGSPVVERVRAGVRNGTDLRLVFDLKKRARPQIIILPPAEDSDHRLVIDLPHGGGAETTIAKRDDLPSRNSTLQSGSSGFRDLVVAIDPGHGGKDPGAIGRRGTREKDIVLNIGLQLRDLIESTPGLRAVMTREDDRYIHLRERTRIARSHDADLFISVHADAFRLASAKGASVYCLSQNGASSEAARWLAAKENSADFVGGASLSGHDEDVASVLLDLAQTKTLESSIDFADRVLKRLGNVARLHKKDVQQAGFAVLKSPDIPSILVESAFISNPDEEMRLRSSSYQREVAQSILEGVNNYYTAHAPQGTRYAML
ncbi:N-acetylmuramoyl-L-alanine amidase [Guyparkeria sp.]|uniref:N-acetylmuramoyl-L-alanine amidase n=1 Tax=Guyparkeria sp. TaxID=2035736 RepID=UPI003970C5C6